MATEQWYTCFDDELEFPVVNARAAVHEHNALPPEKRGPMGAKLSALITAVDAFIEAPFHCAYGLSISLGHQVYLNAGRTILDCAKVVIGDQNLLGPNVQIYCAQHHLDPAKRCVEGLEIAHPVHIGKRVWIGGGAIILASITIGDGTVIGAGCVVTKNAAAGEIVVGSPAAPVDRTD